MESNILEIVKIDSHMEKELNNIQIALSMKENFKEDKNMVKESLYLLINQNIMENMYMEKLKDMAHSNGQMELNILVNGKRV